MTSALMTFDEALAASEAINKNRHLLLGNGFSIACRPDCFTYGRLLDEADFSGLSVEAQALFASVDTADFEAVIATLRAAERVVGLYAISDPDLASRLRADADCLRDALADVLASTHPDHVGSIDESEYRSARRFLQHFGHTFTLNYDLLLYWSLLHDELGPSIANDDGFRADPDDLDAPHVVWNHFQPYKQNVHYLHGGLHLFDGGATLKKVTWKRTRVPIVDQIRSAIDEGEYPLVVTEGTSTEKLRKVQHHAYLAKGLRSFASVTGSLFVHGHSLAQNDDHVLRGISKGKFRGLFVSLFGSVDSETNRQIQARAHLLAADRPEKKPLKVAFYDAGSAQVWDHVGV